MFKWLSRWLNGRRTEGERQAEEALERAEAIRLRVLEQYVAVQSIPRKK